MWTFFDQRVKRFGLLDFKLAQGAAMFLALVLAKAIPEIMQLDILWFALLAVLCAIKPMVTFFAAGAERAA